MSTVPVLAILVCHDGQEWLPDVLSALRHSTVRPRHVLAVDTGSTDDTPRLLAEAADPEAGCDGESACDGDDRPVLDGVLTVPRDTGYAAAVALAVETGRERWGAAVRWLWPLHGDSAPEPGCLDTLLRAARTAPSATVLVPSAADRTDQGLLPEAESFTGASGQGDETPAVPSAGALVAREAWDLGGDTGMPPGGNIGFRPVTAQDGLVLCVPGARLRHAGHGPADDGTPAEGGESTSDAGDAAPEMGREAPEHEPPRLPPDPCAGRTGHEPGSGQHRRVLATSVLSPPVVLAVALTVLALVRNADRLGLDLAGGALLPVGDLGRVWSSYLGVWHPVAGGTSGAAPVALAVLGVLGAPLAPLGGPAALVAVLLIADIPLAALAAYAATRRLPVQRWIRAAPAAAYGLLPAATAGTAQGRLDVVVVHVLLPIVLAGLTAVLTRADRRWLSRSVVCASGVAVVAAFSPPAAALVLAGFTGAYLVLPSPDGRPVRGAATVAIVVLLPPLLLLPWLPALVANPVLLLHGLGGPARTVPGVAGLLGLDPGGAGALPVGVVVVAVSLAAVITRPTRRMVPGFALLALGVAGVVVLSVVEAEPLRGGAPAPGFVGVPLLFAGAGLLLVVLAAASVSASASVPVSVVAVVLVLTLGAGAVLVGGQGPVRAGGGVELASSLTAELAETGRSVLVLDDVVRQTAGRTPRFGDDAVAPVDGSVRRLEDLRRGLLAGSREAVASAAAAGVLFVVLPEGVDGDRIRRAATDLVMGAPPTRDGRTVLRLTPVSAPVTLVSPEQAGRAASGRSPDAELMTGPAAVPVDARLPGVAVRVSDGPAGRLLVLAAAYEPGWRATVDGERAPIVLAWGHQVAVPVPARRSEVTVAYDAPLHSPLLLAQLAAVLVAALIAVPTRPTALSRRR